MDIIVYIVAFSIVVLLTFLAGNFYLPFLKKIKCGQNIREEGPKTHLQKQGTPTMGGLIFLTPVFFLILPLMVFSKELQIVFLATFGYALIGFCDDYIKVVKKRSLGLRAREKFFAEIVLAVLLMFMLVGFLKLDTKVWLPFINIDLDIGFSYYLFLFLVLVGTTNAVNLTDGLDGLAGGAMCFSIATYFFIALILQKISLAIFCVLMIGSLLVFLKYNFFPAKVFMGDTGSLALGGALAILAILTKTEILLILIGLLYVLEALSVMIQVTYFKISGGKRVFLMSPLHHHFEMLGWKEKKVVFSFWGISALTACLGVLIFFINR